MEHTPGPWKLDSGRRIITPSGTFFLSYGKDQRGHVGFKDFCELDRNAHLVAACPELYQLAQTVAAGNTDPDDLSRMAQAILDRIGE